MNLTREQAISEHRKMWNWIADETESQQNRVEKMEYFKAKGITDIPKYKCYCCEFREHNPFYCAGNCIINW